MKKKKRSFWSDGLSVDETRFSVIVVMAVVGFGYALFSHYMLGEITNNLLSLLDTLIYAILGINGVKFVTDSLRSKREEKNDSSYNKSAGEDNTDFTDNSK